MKKSNGYILIILICINTLLGIISILCLQIVGLTKYISVKHVQFYNDDCRFNLLLDLAKKYVKKNKNKSLLEGIIFNDDVVIDGIDTFKGRVVIFLSKKKYIAEITVYINGKEKTIKKNL